MILPYKVMSLLFCSYVAYNLLQGYIKRWARGCLVMQTGMDNKMLSFQSLQLEEAVSAIPTFPWKSYDNGIFFPISTVFSGKLRDRLRRERTMPPARQPDGEL
jgi:hypothetical protein